MRNLKNADRARDIVLEYFELPEHEFKSRRRFQKAKDARYWFYYICRVHFRGKDFLTQQFLAAYTGHNHATVHHAINQMEERINLYPRDRRIAKDLLCELALSDKKKDARAAMAAGAYSDGLKETFSKFSDGLLLLESHMEEDQVMEAWRKVKLKGIFEELKSALEQISNYPQLYKDCLLQFSRDISKMA